MRSALKHLRYNNSGKSSGNLFLFGKGIDLYADGSYGICHLLRREVAVNVIFKPTV